MGEAYREALRKEASANPNHAPLCERIEEMATKYIAPGIRTGKPLVLGWEDAAKPSEEPSR